MKQMLHKILLLSMCSFLSSSAIANEFLPLIFAAIPFAGYIIHETHLVNKYKQQLDEIEFQKALQEYEREHSEKKE